MALFAKSAGKAGAPADLEPAKAEMQRFWGGLDASCSLSTVADVIRSGRPTVAQLRLLKAWCPTPTPGTPTGTRLSQLYELLDGLVAEGG